MSAGGSAATATSRDVGWASATLHGSLREAILRVTALWQVLMIATVAVVPDPTAGQRIGLVVAHAALGAACHLASLRGQVPLWPLVAFGQVLMVADWALAREVDGALSFAAAWLCNMHHLVPALLMRGPVSWALAAAGVFGVPFALFLLHPGWLTDLVLPAVVTGALIQYAARTAVPVLRRFAERMDQEAVARDAARRGAGAARAASFEAAEKARLLHDTVVNTLAAVASGGGAVRDVALVRQRCARDARTLAALLEGSDVETDPAWFENLADGLGIEVVRDGLDETELRRLHALMPADQRAGLAGILREAVQNADKHSRADRVVVHTVRQGDELVVTVTDDGVGFDGAPVPGRGLERSVLRRAQDLGAEAWLTSAPGAGTTVTVRWPLGDGSTPETAVDVLPEVIGLRGRAAWLWTAATGGIGLGLEMINRFGDITPAYGMLAVVAGAGYLAWRDVRRHGELSLFGAALLVAATPAAFLLALAGVDFGRHELILWQSLGAAPPLLILLVHGRTLAGFAVATALLVLTAAATTVALARTTTDIAAVVPVGTAPPLMVVIGWFLFGRTLLVVGEAASAAQRATAAALAEQAAREAAAAARGRWRVAGLRRSLALLESLGAGRADPGAPEVREACAEEEAYLRQLILLDPDLVRMGAHLARALGQARERGVSLVVRTGGADVESDEVAARLGALVVDAVRSAEPGSSVTVSLFASRGQLQLGVVGAPAAVVTSGRWRPPAGWQANQKAYGRLGILEVVRAVEDHEERAA